MVGSSEGSHLVAPVADYLPACLEEELCLVQLFRVELPSLAERCPQGTRQSLGDGHSQVHLDNYTLVATERSVKVSNSGISGFALAPERALRSTRYFPQCS